VPAASADEEDEDVPPLAETAAVLDETDSVDRSGR
jgi:hypothetical protein